MKTINEMQFINVVEGTGLKSLAIKKALSVFEAERPGCDYDCVFVREVEKLECIGGGTSFTSLVCIEYVNEKGENCAEDVLVGLTYDE